MPSRAAPDGHSAAPSLTEGLWTLAARPAGRVDRVRAVTHLRDWLGCAAAGAATPEGRAMATAAGCADRSFALAGAAGALAMGGYGSLYEMDDVHRTALLHPGPVVMPAVLALARLVPDPDLPAAILAGYEVMVRLGAAVGPGHYAMFHNTATCGGIGAAAAAARLLGLSDRQAVWAMGHAMSLAGGLWQCRNEKVATKHLHVADAARRGVQAALWARAGLAGPRLILEGPQGFFAAMACDGDPAAVLAGPEEWRAHQVSFKPWPACRHAHPAIDAALALRGQVVGRAISAVRVTSYADAVLFCDRPQPQTGAEAKFSLQHAVAVALTGGAPVLEDFAPSRLDDPALARLRGLTKVQADPAMTARYPAHFGAAVSVDTADGQTLTASVADAWGDSENPMDAAALHAKFTALCRQAGLPDRQIDGLADALDGLESEEAHDALLAALAALTLPSA